MHNQFVLLILSGAWMVLKIIGYAVVGAALGHAVMGLFTGGAK